MISGGFTGGASSAKVINGSEYRGSLTIQYVSGTGLLYIGFGEDAVAEQSLFLAGVGDSITVYGPLSRKDIYVLGDGIKAAYQEGSIHLNT